MENIQCFLWTQEQFAAMILKSDSSFYVGLDTTTRWWFGTMCTSDAIDVACPGAPVTICKDVQHPHDVIMSEMASQITYVFIICSTVGDVEIEKIMVTESIQLKGYRNIIC